MDCKNERYDMTAPSATDISKGSKKRPYKYAGSFNGVDDDLTDKKRRLTLEQINYLEMSFNADLKLEPERKALIAKELGIRPRQVAIWFQNRRARWKNKQVEQDYEALKVKHDAVVKERENLIEEYETTLQDNKILRTEVDRLRSLLGGEKELDVSSVLSSMKEDQPSSNSELMSPTKSVDCQSEIDDIVMSPEGCKLVMSNLLSQELHETVACGALKAEGDCPFFMSSDDAFGSLPMLVQQLIANGHCFEDAYNIYLGCEYFGGWR